MYDNVSNSYIDWTCPFAVPLYMEDHIQTSLGINKRNMANVQAG